jgi:carbonic anhydrase
MNRTMSKESQAALDEMLAGNKRFREGMSTPRCYSPDDLRMLAENQRPRAAIVACSDSRCAPSIVFDQPLGALFTSRIPGNVVSEGVKWMAELAVGTFGVPLLMVLGHTGCLAVQAVLEERTGGPGGTLRYGIYPAVQKAGSLPIERRLTEAVKENARHTAEVLVAESHIVRSAAEAGTLTVVPAVYHMETGEVEAL